VISVYAVGTCSVKPFGQIFLGDSIYFSSSGELEGFAPGKIETIYTNPTVAATGKPVVTSQGAMDFARLISNVTGGSDV